MRVDTPTVTEGLNEFLEEENSLIQLRFQNEEGDLATVSAASLAQCLIGLNELTGIMHKKGLFDSPVAPDVHVRPVKEGSVIVEALLIVKEALPYAVGALGTGGYFIAKNGKGFVEGFRAMTKIATVPVTDFEYLDEDRVKVTWADGEVQDVPKAAWQEAQAQKVRTKRALSKIMTPLSGEANTLTLRTGSTAEPTEDIEQKEAEAVVDEEIYREFATIPDEVSESSEIFEAEGTIDIVDFAGTNKWKVTAERQTRSAIIEDDAFLRKIDAGNPLRKGEIFMFKIREDTVIKNGRTNRTWAIIEVISRRRGAFDDEPLNSQD